MIPGVRIYMATLTGALNSTPTHGTPEVEAKRKEYNQFIRSAGIFDGVIDFDIVTLDPATGELKAVYQPILYRRWPRRQAAPEPGRLRSDGQRDRYPDDRRKVVRGGPRRRSVSN